MKIKLRNTKKPKEVTSCDTIEAHKVVQLYKRRTRWSRTGGGVIGGTVGSVRRNMGDTSVTKAVIVRSIFREGAAPRAVTQQDLLVSGETCVPTSILKRTHRSA